MQTAIPEKFYPKIIQFFKGYSKVEDAFDLALADRKADKETRLRMLQIMYRYHPIRP